MKGKPLEQQERPPEWSHRPLVLRLYPDRMLRELCQPVRAFDSSLGDFAQEMHTLMRRYQGIGLAAPQVGILSRVIVADIGDGPVFVVNPTIVKKAGVGSMTEGCLSLPGTQVDVQRALAVVIKGWDARGKAIRFRSHGLLARVLQHEIDHLDGILILDYALSTRAVAAGRVYALEATAGLVTDHWRTVEGQEHVPGAPGGKLTLVDTNSALHRAYRATVKFPTRKEAMP
jgi:peptide deformylase